MYKKRSDLNRELLSEQISFRISASDFTKLDAISKNSFITINELIRNLIRDHAHEYVADERLSRKLHISNQIESFFIKKQVISSRNDTNLIKIREILTDFEQILMSTSKNSDHSEIEYTFYEVNKLLKLIAEEDTFLFNNIEGQAKRIFKSKAVKHLVSTLSKNEI